MATTMISSHMQAAAVPDALRCSSSSVGGMYGATGGLGAGGGLNDSGGGLADALCGNGHA